LYLKTEFFDNESKRVTPCSSHRRTAESVPFQLKESKIYLGKESKIYLGRQKKHRQLGAILTLETARIFSPKNAATNLG